MFKFCCYLTLAATPVAMEPKQKLKPRNKRRQNVGPVETALTKIASLLPL